MNIIKIVDFVNVFNFLNSMVSRVFLGCGWGGECVWLVCGGLVGFVVFFVLVLMDL
jgi:hypothetical protein